MSRPTISTGTYTTAAAYGGVPKGKLGGWDGVEGN